MNPAWKAHRRNAKRRSRHVPADTTMWASAHEEPPASVTITWAIDVNDTTIIDLAGDICTEAVQRIRRLFSDVADTSAGNVAIDASDVTFIGSRGLSLLLGTQRRLAERGLRCRVVGPSSAMRRVLEVAQVDDRLCKGFSRAWPPSASRRSRPGSAGPSPTRTPQPA